MLASWKKKQSEREVRNGMNAIYPRLWRYCVVMTGNRDDAGDLAQMTCVRAIEKSDQFEAGTHLDRWVFRMANRIWLNELRSKAVRRGAGLLAVEEIEIADKKPHSEANIFTSEVLTKVGALPEAQRVVVMLVYVEGHKYAEAAEMLDIPIGTVMSRLAAARKTLQAGLAPINVKAKSSVDGRR
jgi:RNA polymerase sigma-70 factor (ECF subfamily)